MDNVENVGQAEPAMGKYIGVKIIKATRMIALDAKVILGDKRGVCGKDDTASGYLVEYTDGYQSWSPKDVFEAAYRACDAMPFGHALEAMKQGKKVKLPHWADDVFISVQIPDENSKMTAPYLYVTSRFGMVPWKETMIELFSDDWQIVE